MSIYRPSGSKVWWYEFQFANQRIRESTKTRSKTLAIEAQRSRHRELELAYNGVKKRASAKLFCVAADEYLMIKEATLAASSLRIEKDNLRHIRPFFDRLLLADIDALEIARYQKLRLAANASPKTINLEVGTIRAILRRNKVWSEIQQDVREQINFENKTLLVGKSKTANGTGRTIPLNARLILVMEMWASHFSNRRPEHYVFPSEKYGAGTDQFTPCVYATDATKPISDWKEAWEGAKKRAGAAIGIRLLKNNPTGIGDGKTEPLQCRFHDLRHTACTRLLEGGVPYPVVATIMGWSASTAIRMAKRYGHIGQKAMREAMEVLGAVHVHEGYPKNSPKAGGNGNARPN